MALTLDYLRLTGDPRAADDLELATLNAGLGAQHPSGRWWTYNTPMDGQREASAHTIVFQARAGTPELNCCSVNGPRVLGMLSEWAVMSASDGLVVNWLGAGRFSGKLPTGSSVRIESSQDAWREGRTELRVTTDDDQPFALHLRTPAWAKNPRAALNGTAVAPVAAGQYLTLHRRWMTGDRLELNFDLPVRWVAGASETAGKVSLYRGPILLAFDPAQNAFDEEAIPQVELGRLAEARRVSLPEPATARERLLRPWLAVDVSAAGARTIRLVDFASAGAAGTRYRSWLTANPAPAPLAFTQIPRDGARVPPGELHCQWRGPRNVRDLTYRVEFATNAEFASGPIWSTNVAGQRLTFDSNGLSPVGAGAGTRVWWRVVTVGPAGESLPDVPPACFTLDSTAPPQLLPATPKLGPNSEVIVHSLRGENPPEFGELKSAQFVSRDATGTEVNGQDQRLVYAVPAWPEEDYTVALRVLIRRLPTDRIGQVFSAWHAGMDDPLRLVVEGGRLQARIEAGAAFSTPGVPISTNQWHTIAAVKQGSTLTLFLDGKAVGVCAVPESVTTQANDCALGGNPHFTGNEFLAARLADFRLYARAFSVVEVKRLAEDH
jgi:hypothetical protein